jgi:hypothetical protein
MEKKSLTPHKLAITSRYADAGFLQEKKFTVVGCGAIGNRLVDILASYDYDITVYDHDTVEEGNVAIQGFNLGQVGLNKTIACIQNNIRRHGIGTIKGMAQKFSANQVPTPVLISAVDSMATRLELFEVFKNSSACELFIDVRVSAETFQLYFVTKSDLDRYLATWHTDEEALKQNCAYKMTVHNALLAVSTTVEQICNYVEGLPLYFSICKQRHFDYEYQ